MAVDGGYGPRGGPRFLDGGAPDLAVDSNALSSYAELVGNRKVGTTAERNAAKTATNPVAVWEGLSWYDTTLRQEFLYQSGNWEAQGVAGVLSSGTQAVGSIGNTSTIGTISSRTFDDTAPHSVLITVTATATTAGSTAAGNLYVRLNNADVLAPATQRQTTLTSSSQNFISLVAVARTVAGSNTVEFRATADSGGASITFGQISIGVKAI
jgi:hypothetical protein